MLSTVDLLVPTSLDQLLLKLKTSSHKTSYPNQEVNCTETSRAVSIPCVNQEVLLS
jgi:hypothetical protein